MALDCENKLSRTTPTLTLVTDRMIFSRRWPSTAIVSSGQSYDTILNLLSSWCLQVLIGASSVEIWAVLGKDASRRGGLRPLEGTLLLPLECLCIVVITQQVGFLMELGDTISV